MSVQTLSSRPHTPTGAGTSIPFDAIRTPGAYVCEATGHLLRVPEDGINPGRSPLISLVGVEPLRVTRISDDPFLPVTQARMAAAGLDLPVNF